VSQSSPGTPKLYQNSNTVIKIEVFSLPSKVALGMGLGVLFGTILGIKLGPSWAMLGTKLAYNGSSTSLRKFGGEKKLQKIKRPCR